ncbi:uncharacterized protein BDW70DRAFT_165409 [Aspergillus foveolatus]|uniref:uncharacterized protein n=1 Tax=Aspergillus foveolatus TaxID=210207 RepID=UPI003CCD4BB0
MLRYELDEHYVWHDHMHLRHHIERNIERMKEQRGIGVRGLHFRDPLTERPRRVQNPWSRRGGFPHRDGDIVAISFLSKEDLEMRELCAP